MRKAKDILLVLAARIILRLLPREALPDWIEAAARYNLLAPGAVEEITRLALAEALE